jgi:peptidoglycan/xylan/chitin deacetylase (PgdA/CDA1 family)
MSVEPATFRAGIDSVLDAGLRAAPVGSTEPGTIAVTFDDGFDDVLRVAAPILADRGVPFSTYVTTTFLDRPGYLTVGALRELALVPGATVGSHGVSHAPLTSCDDAALRREVVDSRSELEQIVCAAVSSFAYPHGIVDRRARDALAAAGYDVAVTSRYGRNTATTDPLLLRRVEVLRDDAPADVVAKAPGAWDWLGLRPSPTR